MRSFLYLINSSSSNCHPHRFLITEATMSKSKKNEEQLVEIENLIALLPKAVKDTSGRNLEIRTQERKTN